MISLADQIAELEREKRLRLKVYPNHISRGMLKESDARWRLAALDAAIATLKQLENAPRTTGLDFGPPPSPQLDPKIR